MAERQGWGEREGKGIQDFEIEMVIDGWRRSTVAVSREMIRLGTN